MTHKFKMEITQRNGKKISKCCITCKYFSQMGTVTYADTELRVISGVCKRPDQTMTKKEVEFSEYSCWEEK